jgi:hypothetical protein
MTKPIALQRPAGNKGGALQKTANIAVRITTIAVFEGAKMTARGLVAALAKGCTA